MDLDCLRLDFNTPLDFDSLFPMGEDCQDNFSSPTGMEKGNPPPFLLFVDPALGSLHLVAFFAGSLLTS